MFGRATIRLGIGPHSSTVDIVPFSIYLFLSFLSVFRRINVFIRHAFLTHDAVCNSRHGVFAFQNFPRPGRVRSGHGSKI